jgi:hypothetical protein
VLDENGILVKQFDYSVDTKLVDFAASQDGSTVGFVECKINADFPDQVTFVETNKMTLIKRSVMIEKIYGEMRQNPAMSNNGLYFAVMLGATSICVIKTSDGTISVMKNLITQLPAGHDKSEKCISSISDDGSFIVQYNPVNPQMNVIFNNYGKLVDSVQFQQ